MGETEDRAELVRLQNDWMQAWIRRDLEALESILGEDFTLTSVTTDAIVDRKSWLAALGRVIGSEFRYDSFHLQLYGDAAVVKSRATQKAQIDGKPWEGEFLLTDVWIRRAGRWRVVTRHASRPSGVFAGSQMGGAR
jgi:ketosteroid isomerase-like protein